MPILESMPALETTSNPALMGSCGGHTEDTQVDMAKSKNFIFSPGDTIRRIRDTLSRYPRADRVVKEAEKLSAIVKELVQNAEDAKAHRLFMAWTPQLPSAEHPWLQPNLSQRRQTIVGLAHTMLFSRTNLSKQGDGRTVPDREVDRSGRLGLQ